MTHSHAVPRQPIGLRLVQSKAANGNTATATATFDAAPQAGSLLVAALRLDKLFAALTLPSGFTDAVHDDDDLGVFSVDIAYEANIAGGHTSTIAYTWTGAVQWGLGIYEFAGAAAAPLDKTNSNDPVGTALTSCASGSTGTLTQANEVVIAMAGLSGTNGGGDTIDNASFSQLAGTGTRVQLAYALTNATTALNPTFGWTTGRGAVGAIATFKGL